MARIVVTGASGQVGWELARALQPLGEVVAVDRRRLDICDGSAVRDLVRSEQPDAIINAAAYTAVDRAEQQQDAAHAINAKAVAELAAIAGAHGCLLIHFSTDYVFDGAKPGDYTEQDAPAPLNVYGTTKWLGERALQASDADWLCLRTSWVYSARGRNFLRTILQHAQQRPELRVVADQFGAPTSARLIADATAHIVGAALRERVEQRFRSAVLHLTAAGSTSWHGFAQAILAAAHRTSLAPRVMAQKVVPIPTSDYPTPAQRPANSRLSCAALTQRFGIRLPHWQSALELCVADLAETASI